MCINCNIPAPVCHYVCDLLGIEKNKYGLASSSLDKLTHLLLEMKYDDNQKNYVFKTPQFSNDLKAYLIENKKYDSLKAAAIADGIDSASPVDNTVFNFVFARYFPVERATENVDEDFVRTWRIPLELLSSDPKWVHVRMFKVNYKQTRPIPRKILESWKMSESKLKEHCKKYGFELLDEPIADIEPDPEQDDVWRLKQ